MKRENGKSPSLWEFTRNFRADSVSGGFVKTNEYVSVAGWSDERAFVCPSVTVAREGAATIQYGMNKYFDPGQWGPRTSIERYGNFTLSFVRNPANTYLLGDKTLLWHSPIIKETGYYLPDPRHKGDAHFVYVDGHVESVSWPDTLDSERYRFLD